MEPKETFESDVVVPHQLVAATKVKGLLRDALETVRFSSPADCGNILKPCHNFIRNTVAFAVAQSVYALTQVLETGEVNRAPRFTFQCIDSNLCYIDLNLD